MRNKIILALSILGLIFGNTINNKNIVPPKEPTAEENNTVINEDVVYSMYAVPDIEDKQIIQEKKKQPIKPEFMTKYGIPNMEPPQINNDENQEPIKPVEPQNPILLKYGIPDNKDYSVKKYAIFDPNQNE